MRLIAILCLLPACTTIHAAGGGAEPGEFYAVAQRDFLGITGPSYVLRCQEVSDPLGVILVCNRVLVGKEAGELAPGKSPSGRVRFVRSTKE